MLSRPWIELAARRLLTSSSFWLILTLMAALPWAIAVWVPWGTSSAQRTELGELAVLLGACWGLRQASELQDLWIRGGSAVRFWAPIWLIAVPSLFLLTVIALSLYPLGSLPDVDWFALLLSGMTLALFGRCLLALPSSADGHVLAFLIGAWWLPLLWSPASWFTGIGHESSRSRYLPGAEPGSSHLMARILPILAWVLLSWALCLREGDRHEGTHSASR